MRWRNGPFGGGPACNSSGGPLYRPVALHHPPPGRVIGTLRRNSKKAHREGAGTRAHGRLPFPHPDCIVALGNSLAARCTRRSV